MAKLVSLNFIRALCDHFIYLNLHLQQTLIISALLKLLCKMNLEQQMILHSNIYLTINHHNCLEVHHSLVLKIIFTHHRTQHELEYKDQLKCGVVSHSSIVKLIFYS